MHPKNLERLSTVLQLLTEQASSGFAKGVRILVNAALARGRFSALDAEPYQHC